MSDTTQLGLPLLQPSQAQKHVTVNEAFGVLDAVVQLSVKNAGLNIPPALPLEGDRYIVGVTPIGVWSGRAKMLAVWAAGDWVFHVPMLGWIAWDEAGAGALVYTGGTWSNFVGDALASGAVSSLGIGAAADPINHLVFNGTNALFTSALGIDATLNKTTAAHDASISFKTAFSARAIVGLLGNDNFGLKVSANGSTYNPVFDVSAANGTLDFKSAPSLMGTDLRSNMPAGAFSVVDDVDNSKKVVFVLSGISTATTRSYTLPNTTSELAALAGTQTFSGAKIFSGTFTVTAPTATLGNSTGVSTASVGSGINPSGIAKTINIGTGGASGSTTIVNVGSATSGAFGATVINTPTVTFASNVSTISAPSANFGALYAGVGGATADATNRLSVTAPATLLSHAGGGHQVRVSKATASDTASLSFQNGSSTRATLGILGNDDLTIRVSPDGTTFSESLLIDKSNGRVTLPNGAAIGAVAADPASPQDGLIWYNATTNQLRTRMGGMTRAMFADNITFVQPLAGDFVTATLGAGASTGTLAGASNRMDIFPFNPRGDLSIDQLVVNVTAAVAGASGKIVVYAANSSGHPTTKMVETGTLDFSVVGLKVATVALQLYRGYTYWMGVRASSTATLSAFGASTTPDLTTTTANTVVQKVLRRTVTFASAAPDPWGYVTSEANNSNATAIWLRSM